MFNRLREDIASIIKRDPAARNAWEVLTCYPGLHAIVMHRWANWCWRHGLKWSGRFISHVARGLTGIEIHPAARLGRRVFIDHGMGVVIGETAEIGDDVLIYHGVTLGGTGKDRGKRHPTIGNNVFIGSGAKILGPITVGDNARIGANSAVLKNVPAGATVTGMRARIVKINGKRVEECSSCINTDEMRMQLFRLEEEVYLLKKELRRLKGEAEPERAPKVDVVEEHEK